MRRFKPKKVYGEYTNTGCHWCGKTATAENEQGLSTCSDHQQKRMEDVKCACGSWLELKAGKYGSYFNCLNCGNMNYEKGMKMKELMSSTDSGLKTQKVYNHSDSYIENTSLSGTGNATEKTPSSAFMNSSYGAKTSKSSSRKEITIRSDDPLYFS